LADLQHNAAQGPNHGPAPITPSPLSPVNIALALREHTYNFQPTTDKNRVRIATEHIPTAHVTISYLLTPDASQLAFKLIRSGAVKAGITL
jgi:hypothetical protein